MQKDFIPFDKSWTIRMGVLDLLHGSQQIVSFLESQTSLNDDLLALKKAAVDWENQSVIFVGESGTLFRFLQYASWKLALNKTFEKKGTLPLRNMNQDASVINWKQSQLLELDHGTSQWASAAVLLGDPERLENPPFKLQLTYEAFDHWHSQHQQGKTWVPRRDPTIEQQAKTFIQLLRGDSPSFIPEQAEDYCFARIFDYITREEGLQRWPNLVGHESNRIEAMETVWHQIQNNELVVSDDHRVVQAVAMFARLNQKSIQLSNANAVNKSWPEFWNWLNSLG